MRGAAGIIGGLAMTAPLGVEDERRLYPVIQRGREAAAALEAGTADAAERRRLTRLRHAGQDAESRLLRATCGLVRARVMERGYRFGNEELEAAGVEGLVNALRRFDPEKGTRFSTYANYWIMKLVNQAIQQQAGLSDSEMRHVLAVQKMERATPARPVTVQRVSRELRVSPAKATEILQTARDLASRRFEPSTVEELHDVRQPADPADAPAWVIDELRRLCGEDFDAFWQHTFHTASLEEIARTRGMSRQALSKRLERCRRAVRESPSAQRLRDWFASQ
ncbi:MAG: sigma-70 family RNA polymerase sigma factor [Acidobacteriota bacterium]|nr:sigma-70 family RNA polymerase sigma factor [Acidobacteriota bacterium]